MYSQLKWFALPIAILLNMSTVPAYSVAQTPQPDARVKAALDAGGLKYEVDKDGDFKIVLDLGEGRTQVAFISSKTDKIQGLEIREIFSAAYIVEGALPGDVSNKLLLASRTRTIGAWEVMKTGNSQLVVFSTKIQSSISPVDLKTSIIYTMVSADKMEKELTNGKDTF
jgi:hypothetical protein